MRRASDDDVIAVLEPLLLPRRVARMRRVLANRSAHVTFVFERMVDPHNFSAAVRSLDGFSFQDIHLVSPDTRVGMSRGIAQGAERWITLHEHRDMPACVAAVRESGYRVLASQLGSPSADRVDGNPRGGAAGDPAEDRVGATTSDTADTVHGEGGRGPLALPDLDFQEPTAFVFGNEHAGVSEEVLELADGTFRIDMLGFVESFNLSVAAALTAYEARNALNRLARECGDPRRFALGERRQRRVYAQWLRRCVRHADRIVAEVQSAHGGRLSPRQGPSRSPNGPTAVPDPPFPPRT